MKLLLKQGSIFLRHFSIRKKKQLFCYFFNNTEAKKHMFQKTESNLYLNWQMRRRYS